MRYKMKKVLIIIVSSIIILIILGVCIWFTPVVCTIPENGLIIDHYAKEGKIALLCKSGGNTGPDWRVHEFSGTVKTPEYINIKGNTPKEMLKFPTYIYGNSTFLFIGNFEQNTEMFVVDEWHFVGDIERIHLISPYPKKGLNYYEIKKTNSEFIK